MYTARLPFFPTTADRVNIMRNATTPESTASTRKGSRSKSKEKATGNAPSSQRPPDPRVGTRSVNTLSGPQLERKRANDREAQRIIRQRTKEHIENLERQVTELSERKEQQNQEQQLNRALERNSELEEQIAVLQRQVADMALLLQYRQSPGAQEFTDTAPAYGSTSLNEPSTFSLPVSHGYPPTTTVESRSMYNPYDIPMSMRGPVSLSHDPSSSGVSSITSASYSEDADVITASQTYNLHPAPSAPPMQAYHHQGLPHQGPPSQGPPSQGPPSQGHPSQGHPPTSMAMPSHQYSYSGSYIADPWNPNRSG